MNTEIDKLMRSNDKLFEQLEFWRSTAIERGAPEDAYEVCLAVAARQFEEFNPYNTGEIHR